MKSKGQPPVQIRALGERYLFSSYLWPVSSFPVPAAEREAYLSRLFKLNTSLGIPRGGTGETLLQLPHLHHESANDLVSKHGAAWMPKVGVGVWPHRPPPGIWTREEFEGFVPGQTPRPPISMVIRLEGEPRNRENVLHLMGGRGVLIRAGLLSNSDEFYRYLDQYFRTFITDPLHLAFPFFFPLFEASTLPEINPDVAGRLLARVEFYWRESVEDGGVLILSKGTLEPQFKDLGWEVTKLGSA